LHGLKVVAVELRDKADKLEGVVQSLADEFDDLDPDLSARFDDALGKLFEIPADHPGPYPPVVAPCEVGLQIAAMYRMPPPEAALEMFIRHAEAVLAQVEAGSPEYLEAEAKKGLGYFAKMTLVALTNDALGDVASPPLHLV